MANLNEALRWFTDRQGNVHYLMGAWGPSKYDCSSAVYSALIAGGFFPAGLRGYTDPLFNDLESRGWVQVLPGSDGIIKTQKGDVFIWGERGNSANAAGHTGMFIDNNDNIIHCNFGYDGITVNPHDTIWEYNGRPPITVYRHTGEVTTTPTPGGSNQVTGQRIIKSGYFTPDRSLPVSGDTDPYSPALATYSAGQSFSYDSYILENGYAWLSYIAASGNRRYIAVGPDDGNAGTTWGKGFFN